MRGNISWRTVLVLLTAAMVWATPAGAQVVGTWNHNGNGSWSTGAYWTGGIPTSAGDTANITYNITGNYTITIDSPRTVGILNIGDTGWRYQIYTIAASGEGTLTFDNLGSAAQINVLPMSRGDSINAPVLLNSDLEIRNKHTNALTINGTVTANSAGAKTISNLGTNNGYVRILGDIADGGGGTVSIIQNSAKSKLILGGDNSYSGPTTVSAGVLNIQDGTALGTTDAGTSVASGAALQMQGGITVGAEALTLNGTGVSDDGVLRNMDGVNTYGGALTLVGATRINSDSGTLILSNAGAITGDGSALTVGGSGDTTINSIIDTTTAALNKDGTGTLTLSGANTYTGGTNISGGALALSGAGTLGDSANALTMSGGRLDLGGTSRTVGAVSITAGAGSADTIGNGSLTGTSYSAGNASGNAIVSANLLGDTTLTMTGAGMLTLSGANAYTGGTTVSDGVLLAATPAALPGYDSAGKVVFNGGTVGVSVGGSGWTTTQVDTLLSNATKTGGALGIDTTAGDLTQWTAFTTTNLGPVLGLTKLGPNMLTLDQVNTYTGTTAIRGGTLKLQNAGSGLTQTLGPLTLAGADVTLQSDNAGSGTLSTTFGALTARATGNTANIVSTGGTNGTDNIINLTGAAGFIDAGVFFNGADYAAMDATGYVRALAYGTDPYTSAVDTVAPGTHVKLTATRNNVGNVLSLNLAGDGVNCTGSLTAGGILKSGGGSSTISGGTAVATGAELVIRTDSSSDLLTIETPVTGGALTKSGAGTLTLSGVNTYAGATYVNGGTFEIGGAGKVGNGNYAGAIAIADGATFKYNSTANQTLTSAISGGGALIQGSGRLTLSGANTGFNGTVTLNGGNLVLNNAAALGNASCVTIAGGAQLQVSGNVPAINTPITLVGTGSAVIHAVTGYASLDINAPISGDGNLQLQSTRASYSYFTLNAQSDYTGSTVFCGETPGNWAGRIYVALGTDDALPTGTVLSMSGNFAQFDLNGYNQTLGGLNDRPAGAWWLAWEIVNTSATPATLTVNNAANCTFSGALGITAADGNFGLTKGGAGTFTLASAGPHINGGVNTYTGPTTINAGKLVINSSLVNSDVTVVGGALGGTGTIGGSVVVQGGGTIAPGAGVGTLAVGTTETASSVTMAADSIYEWEFDGATGDLVAIEGDLSLTAGWKITLVDANGTPEGIPDEESEYDLFTYTGAFSGSLACVIDASGVTSWSRAKIGQDTTPGNGRIFLTFGAPIGDADGDLDVDAADYIALKRNIGRTTGATTAQGDFDGDGDVDWDDLVILQDTYGTGSAGAPAIPEPCSAMLLMLGAVALLRRRRA